MKLGMMAVGQQGAMGGAGQRHPKIGLTEEEFRSLPDWEKAEYLEAWKRGVAAPWVSEHRDYQTNNDIAYEYGTDANLGSMDYLYPSGWGREGQQDAAPKDLERIKELLMKKKMQGGQ